MLTEPRPHPVFPLHADRLECQLSQPEDTLLTCSPAATWTVGQSARNSGSLLTAAAKGWGANTPVPQSLRRDSQGVCSILLPELSEQNPASGPTEAAGSMPHAPLAVSPSHTPGAPASIP